MVSSHQHFSCRYGCQPRGKEGTHTLESLEGLLHLGFVSGSKCVSGIFFGLNVTALRYLVQYPNFLYLVVPKENIVLILSMY